MMSTSETPDTMQWDTQSSAEGNRLDGEKPEFSPPASAPMDSVWTRRFREEMT